MNKKSFPIKLVLSTSLLFLVSAALVLPAAADDTWTPVSSKDGKISVLFPDNIAAHPQVSVDKTAAGKVTSYFGEYHGDGIILAASGADIPRLARMAGDKITFNGSKDTYLASTKGTEVSFTETTVQGAPAFILVHKGTDYRGEATGPYQGRALFIEVDKRMYIINSVIIKSTPEAKAAEEKLFQSIKISG